MICPKIVGIVHTHANRILYYSTALYCGHFRARGYDTELIDLDDIGALQRLADILNSGNTAFGFGLQGVGSKLEADDGENLWLAARVPFLCLHYDNPCYNPVNHVSDSPYVANFYFFPSFLDIKHRYLSSPQIAALLPFELLEIPPKPALSFVHRTIKLLFMKTGASLDEPVRQLNSLIPPLRDGAFDQLARAECDPNLQLCDLVQEIFDTQQINRDDHPKLFWGIAQIMDIFLRRKRAIDFIEWFKFQPGAVVVGDGWDFISRDGAQAEFHPAMSADQAFPLYGQTKFICNTNPYGRDVLHERILHGLLMCCNVITDTNAWLDHDVADFTALHRFDWNHPLDDQLQPVLNDLEAARLAIQTVRDETIIKFQHKHTIDMILNGAQEIAATLGELTQAPAQAG